MNPRLERALLLLEQSRHELAEQELRQVLADAPEDAMAHAVLGICLSQHKQFAEAAREVETAIHLAPEESFAFYAHAIVLEKRNRFAEAEAAINEAIGMDPYQPDYFAQLAQLQFAQRRWRDSLEAAEQGLALDPEDVNCTNLHAMALVKLGRKIEAGEAIETALKRDPEDAFSQANMGWSLMERGEHEKAMEHFREALRLNPEMEWARAGIIEAMKARYFLYRIMLNWFLWMMKLSGQAQWGVIVGMYLGYHVLRQVAAANPVLAPWIMPILVAYVTFAIMTWVASPLFNLVLRLNRFGRLALSREQIRTSTWVGLCVVGALGFIVAYFAIGGFEFLEGALAFGLMIPVLAHIYDCSHGWPRATILLAAIALGGLAMVVVSASIAEQFLSGTLGRLVHGFGSIAFLVFVIGAVVSQFGVNALVAARPRDESARAVWLVGGLLLSIGALASFAVVGLAIFAAAYEQYAAPSLFTQPIRATLVVREDLPWTNVDETQKATDELVSAGFVKVADYVIDDMHDVNIRYLLHEPESVVGEILEHPTMGHYVSVATLYEDGHLLSYYRGPPDQLELPPELIKKRFDLSAGQLYEQLLKERPREGVRPVSASLIVPISERFYATEIDFLLERGGPSEAEIAAIGTAEGMTLSKLTIARVQRQWRQQAGAKVEQFVLDRFLAGNLQFGNLDRSRLLCIHKLRSARELVDYCDHAHWKRGQRPSDPELEALAGDGTPREAFSRIAELTTNLKRIGEASEPIGTDIYVRE